MVLVLVLSGAQWGHLLPSCHICQWSPAQHRSRVTSASSPLIVTMMLRGHCSTAPLLPLHMVSQCCSGTCCSLITPSINQYLARAETKQSRDNKWDNQQWAAGYL